MGVEYKSSNDFDTLLNIYTYHVTIARGGCGTCNVLNRHSDGQFGKGNEMLIKDRMPV